MKFLYSAVSRMFQVFIYPVMNSMRFLLSPPTGCHGDFTRPSQAHEVFTLPHPGRLGYFILPYQRCMKILLYLYLVKDGQGAADGMEFLPCSAQKVASSNHFWSAKKQQYRQENIIGTINK
jgi:hypothetical protein